MRHPPDQDHAEVLHRGETVMSVSVRIPTILRTYTDGASEVEIEPAEPTLAAYDVGSREDPPGKAGIEAFFTARPLAAASCNIRR